MTPREVFDLAISLEEDLADFYQQIGRIEDLKPFADIFSFMTDHSADHAARIQGMAAEAALPALNTAPMKDLHERLKSSLLEKIQHEKDPTAVMQLLAQTEDAIGQLYRSVAQHYQHLSDAFSAVADQFEKLSQEEFGHRDYILDQQDQAG